MSEPIQVRYESRSARETVDEIGIFAIAMIACAYAYIALTNTTGDSGVTLEHLSVAGEAVLGQIGWGMGAYLPIMLGFYAVVASGRLPGNEPADNTTHRTMGLAATALAASTIPLFLLVLIHCITKPEKAGVMLVITPVMGSVFLLAFMLGRFAGIPVRDQIRGTKRSRSRARARRAILPPGSTLSAWKTWLITSAAGSFVGTAVYFLAPPRQLHLAPSLGVPMLICLLSCFTSALALVCLYYWFSGDRSDALLGLGVYGILASAPVVIFVLVLFEIGADASSGTRQDARAAAIAILAMSASVLLSTLWSSRLRPRGLHQWTLHAAGVRLARRSLDKTYGKATKKLEKLMLQAQGDSVKS